MRLTLPRGAMVKDWCTGVNTGSMGTEGMDIRVKSGHSSDINGPIWWIFNQPGKKGIPFHILKK